MVPTGAADRGLECKPTGGYTVAAYGATLPSGVSWRRAGVRPFADPGFRSARMNPRRQQRDDVRTSPPPEQRSATSISPMIPSRGASPERYRAKLAPGDLDDGSRRSAVVSGRVVIPPAAPCSQSADRPAAKLTVPLDQLRHGAFDHVAVVHDRLPMALALKLRLTAD